MEFEVIDTISFRGVTIDVYGTWKDPLFILRDVAKILNYRQDNAARLADLCEADETLNVTIRRAGQRRTVTVVTETGLYDILSQMRTEPARAWRRVLIKEIRQKRINKEQSISELFEDWDERAVDIWFDEETGKMMEAVNVPGGDVEVREYTG